ncbi:MAG TPA: hypothetical protein VG738_08440 [Chitinophagaceae bacterium]|nr:hypothetical protein [Chitinophagaceae bacterium]
MNYQLILLNNPSNQDLSKRFSSFVCMPKQRFNYVARQANAVLGCPQLIVMQSDSAQIKHDLELLNFLKDTPVFKNTPVIVFTLGYTADDTALYFSHGATTCVVMPVEPAEWTNIIHYIPAYWLDAA